MSEATRRKRSECPDSRCLDGDFDDNGEPWLPERQWDSKKQTLFDFLWEWFMDDEKKKEAQ